MCYALLPNEDITVATRTAICSAWNGLERKAIARCHLLRLCNSVVQFAKHISERNIAVFEENEDVYAINPF